MHNVAEVTCKLIIMAAVVGVSGADTLADGGKATQPIREELNASFDPMLPLEQGWNEPPRIAQTRVWWWWLNGNVTKEAITLDLEAMKTKGIGGANIIDAGGHDQKKHAVKGAVPAGPKFASPEWTELFKHAVAEADRLGLELGFNIQSGWNLGGPMIPYEHASKKLTYSSITLSGGRQVALELPKPRAQSGFYRNVAVVAFPIKADEHVSLEVAASDSKPSNKEQLVFDGDAASFWVSQSAPSVEHPAFLEISFGSPIEIDELHLTGRKKYGPKEGWLEFYDGRNWMPVRKDIRFEDAETSVKFSPLVAEALRLHITDSYDPKSPKAPRNVQVAEVRLLHAGKSLSSLMRADKTQLSDFKIKAYYEEPDGGAGTRRSIANPSWHLLEPGASPAQCRLEEVVDLTDHFKDGKLEWDAPIGQWRIVRFGYTYSGASVSHSSNSWKGPAIDYLDADAFDFYWEQVLDPVLAEVKPYLGTSLNFLHTDSWELKAVNWTAKLPEKFKEQHGYSIDSWLPALAGYTLNSAEETTRFLNDFRATLAELIVEGKYRRFSERAHAVGVGIHPESGGPHAAPIDALRNLGISDVPMGEFWNRSETHRKLGRDRFFVKQTASVANVYGRRLCLAEAFTTVGPHWERSPGMLKHDFDRAVCEGHNLTMWHTFDCSPRELGKPGQVYFAGTHLNPNVTWWPMVDGFVDYMNRVHFMMQQGFTKSDVLYYVGENIPAFVRLKSDDPAGVLPGYDYDVIDTQSLIHRLRVDATGMLVLPHGIGYEVLALPAHDAYDLAILEKIAQLVEDGATVCGRRPQKRYGISGGAAADQRFAEWVEALWGSGKITEAPTRMVLEKKGVAPDFTWKEAEPQTSDEHLLTIDYIHKTSSEANVYFVANRLHAPRRIMASFRQVGLQPELWDAVTGRIIPDAAYTVVNGRTEMELRLEADESVLVVFRTPADAITARVTNLEKEKELLSLDEDWEVTFDPEWGPSEPVVFDSLNSWTEHSDPMVKYFSGIAVYRKDVEIEASVAGKPVYLDLGDVKEIARVVVNGTDLGTVWVKKQRLDITSAIREGQNRLEIHVANNWPNRLIGDELLPEPERRTWTNFRKFKKDSPLFLSGLLGPVRLLTVE